MRSRVHVPQTIVCGTVPDQLSECGRNRVSAPDMPQELAEIAALEDRSQHKIALKAMRLGLEALRTEHS